MEDQSIYWNAEKLNNPDYDPDREYWDYVKQWRGASDEDTNTFKKMAGGRQGIQGQADWASDTANDVLGNPFSRGIASAVLPFGGLIQAIASFTDAFKPGGKNFDQKIAEQKNKDWNNRLAETPDYQKAFDDFRYRKFLAELNNPGYQQMNNPYSNNIYKQGQ